MSIYNYKIFFVNILIVITFSGCVKSKPKLIIKPLDMLKHTDSLFSENKMLYFKSDYFLVSNYSNTQKNYDYIDSFAFKVYDTAFAKYTNYHIFFYKESKETNAENILSNPRVVDRYSNGHDKIFVYGWDYGKLLSKDRYEDGEIVDNKDKDKITIEDIKPDTIRR
jgi:hypothetical protein